MIERKLGEYIPFETRHDAHKSIDKNQRYKQIIECLKEQPNQTAKEIACMMTAKGYVPYADRGFTAPRLTEMTQNGIVEPVGKKECKWTHKMVSCYALRSD